MGAVVGSVFRTSAGLRRPLFNSLCPLPPSANSARKRWSCRLHPEAFCAPLPRTRHAHSAHWTRPLPDLFLDLYLESRCDHTWSSCSQATQHHQSLNSHQPPDAQLWFSFRFLLDQVRGIETGTRRLDPGTLVHQPTEMLQEPPLVLYSELTRSFIYCLYFKVQKKVIRSVAYLHQVQVQG